MKSFDTAEPRIVFEWQSGKVSGWLETFYKDSSGRLIPANNIDIDPAVLIFEYPGRCLKMQKRNPDMPKEQAVEIALRQWALELMGKL